MNRIVIFLSGALALGGCASNAATTPASTPATTSAPRRITDLITSEELATVAHDDLYAAISQLRPTYFVTRGVTSPGVATAPEVVQVYVDGAHRGDLQSLHQIQASDVKEVRHLSATEATQRYGTGHTMGAILVTTRK
jgi:hypothetical protein